MHFCTGKSDVSTPFLKSTIDGAGNGRARGWPGGAGGVQAQGPELYQSWKSGQHLLV